MSNPHVCPNCGERVTAFAAGCALCGAQLDPRRAQRKPSSATRLLKAWKPRVGDRRPALDRRPGHRLHPS